MWNRERVGKAMRERLERVHGRAHYITGASTPAGSESWSTRANSA
jgi:hypothetical protein